MGNLDGWGGPLSDDWINRGNALQHQYLQRARELGMTPVLPAFAGFVPAALRDKLPGAPIHNAAGWGDFRATHYVEPTSALFAQIGTAFVKRLCAEYGCEEQWFTAGTCVARPGHHFCVRHASVTCVCVCRYARHRVSPHQTCTTS